MLEICESSDYHKILNENSSKYFDLLKAATFKLTPKLPCDLATILSSYDEEKQSKFYQALINICRKISLWDVDDLLIFASAVNNTMLFDLIKSQLQLSSEALIRMIFNANQNYDGETALHIAAEYSDKMFIALLDTIGTQKDIIWSLKDAHSNYRNPLYLAVIKGRVDTLQVLHDRIGSQKMFELYQSPWSYILDDSYNVIYYNLISFGIIMNSNYAAVKLMINFFKQHAESFVANLNQGNTISHNTLCHLIAENGTIDVVTGYVNENSILSNFTQELRTYNTFGKTPLHIAAKNCNPEIFKVFINIVPENERLAYLQPTKHHDDVEDRISVIELILKNSTEISCDILNHVITALKPNDFEFAVTSSYLDNDTGLHYAAAANFEFFKTILLSIPADNRAKELTKKNNQNQTPLAILKNNTKVNWQLVEEFFETIFLSDLLKAIDYSYFPDNLDWDRSNHSDSEISDYSSDNEQFWHLNYHDFIRVQENTASTSLTDELKNDYSNELEMNELNFLPTKPNEIENISSNPLTEQSRIDNFESEDEIKHLNQPAYPHDTLLATTTNILKVLNREKSPSVTAEESSPPYKRSKKLPSDSAAAKEALQLPSKAPSFINDSDKGLELPSKDQNDSLVEPSGFHIELI